MTSDQPPPAVAPTDRPRTEPDTVSASALSQRSTQQQHHHQQQHSPPSTPPPGQQQQQQQHRRPHNHSSSKPFPPKPPGPHASHDSSYHPTHAPHTRSLHHQLQLHPNYHHPIPQPHHQLHPTFPAPQHLSAPTAWISLAAPQSQPSQPPSAQLPHTPSPLPTPVHHTHPHPIPHAYHHFYPPAHAVHHHVHHPAHVAVHHAHPSALATQPSVQSNPHLPPTTVPTPYLGYPNDFHYPSAVLPQDPDRISKLEAELAAAHKEIDTLRTRLAELEKERVRAADATKIQSRYWTPDEHKRFIEALQKFGPKDVRAIANFVGSRNATQVRTHAQKYFLRMARETRGGRAASLQDARKRSRSESDLVRVGHAASTPPDSPVMSSRPSLLSVQAAAGSGLSFPGTSPSAGPGPTTRASSSSNPPNKPSPLAMQTTIARASVVMGSGPFNELNRSHSQGGLAPLPCAPSAALPPSGMPTSPPSPYQVPVSPKPPSPRSRFSPRSPPAASSPNHHGSEAVRMVVDVPFHESLSSQLPPLSGSKASNDVQPTMSVVEVVMKEITPRLKPCTIPDSSGISLLSIVASDRNLAYTLTETPDSAGVRHQNARERDDRQQERMEQEPAKPEDIPKREHSLNEECD